VKGVHAFPFLYFFFFLSLDCLAGNEVGDNLKKIIIYDAKQRGDFVQQPANNGRVNIQKCPPTQDPLQVLFQARINASTRPIYLHHIMSMFMHGLCGIRQVRKKTMIF
jgi:hypothetical protein